MAEIATTPRCGRKVASLFSGCGGSSLGYKMAGFDVAYASEFVEAARATYAVNFPGTHVDPRDIRTVQAEDILKVLGMEPRELDVLDGSPPCASFSTAGKRHKAWGKTKKYSDTEQRTDDLFFEYVRILKGVQPKVFVAENVSGLVKGAAKGYFIEIFEAMQSCGYRVAARVLDAQWLGVPQMRQRVIFVGVREDLGVDPAHPEPLVYRYSIREACPWIAGAKSHAHGPNSWPSAPLAARKPAPTVSTTPNGAGYYHHEVVIERARSGDGKTGYNKGFKRSVDLPAPVVMAGGIGGSARNQDLVSGATSVVDPETGENISFDGYAIGKEFDHTAAGGISARYYNLTRPRASNPSFAVTAMGGQIGAASVVHPTEKRKFTIAELRRICSFPDDFVLTGTYAQRWERLGRAVPPLMMRAIAEVVRDKILCVG